MILLLLFQYLNLPSEFLDFPIFRIYRILPLSFNLYDLFSISVPFQRHILYLRLQNLSPLPITGILEFQLFSCLKKLSCFLFVSGDFPFYGF